MTDSELHLALARSLRLMAEAAVGVADVLAAMAGDRPAEERARAAADADGSRLATLTDMQRAADPANAPTLRPPRNRREES